MNRLSDGPPARVLALNGVEALSQAFPMRVFLGACSALFRAGVTARRWSHARGLLYSETVCLPVISIGGLEAGGTGKTPVTGALAAMLRERKPLILLRGYRGRMGGGRPYWVSGTESPRDVGDEALLHKSWVPEASVVIAGDRLAAANMFGRHSEVILLDDGFQHHRLRRNLDIVVCRTRQPSPMLPLGRSREPIAALERADILWMHRVEGEQGEASEAWWSPYFQGPIVRSTLRLEHVRPLIWASRSGDADAANLCRMRFHSRWGELFNVNYNVIGSNDLININFIAFSCIARSDRFELSLRARGLNISQSIRFPDHWMPSGAELDWVERVAIRNGADAVIVTEKDAVRLEAISRPGARLPWWVALGRVHIEEPAIIDKLILKII